MNKKELKEFKRLVGNLESGLNDYSLFMDKLTFDYLQKK